MKTWTISRRLNLIIVSSILMMAGLAIINWLSLDHLGTLQEASMQRAVEAGEIRYAAGMGAEMYRVVADTYIN